jgi:hypothetical protein
MYRTRQYDVTRLILLIKFQLIEIGKGKDKVIPLLN